MNTNHIKNASSYTAIQLPSQTDGFDWAISEDGVGLITGIDEKPLRFVNKSDVNAEIKKLTNTPHQLEAKVAELQRQTNELHDCLKAVANWLYETQPEFLRDYRWKTTERRILTILEETYGPVEAEAIKFLLTIHPERFDGILPPADHQD